MSENTIMPHIPIMSLTEFYQSKKAEEPVNQGSSAFFADSILNADFLCRRKNAQNLEKRSCLAKIAKNLCGFAHILTQQTAYLIKDKTSFSLF